MELDDKKLKLIFVLKIGYNSNDEGLYEFIFSTDETNILIEDWCWDLIPACDNAQPPTKDYINAVFNLKTSNFDLFCLHEAVDRPYMHGYHTIHALAYEVEREDNTTSDGFNQYEEMFEKSEEETSLLVFHYGMTLARIKDMLNARKIILKNNEFVDTSSIKLE
jgi:hypothetical protein